MAAALDRADGDMDDPDRGVDVSTWPPTYLSLDPSGGLPVAADVAHRMNAVISGSEKLTKSQFATRLKENFPEYLDLPDDELVKLVLNRYPHYRQFITELDWLEQHAPTIEEVNTANRKAALVRGAALWLVPPIALYVLGWAIAWIYRGFRTS